jgi:hypothetical protein
MLFEAVAHAQDIYGNLIPIPGKHHYGNPQNFAPGHGILSGMPFAGITK